MNFLKRLFGRAKPPVADGSAATPERAQQELEELLEREFDQNPGNWTHHIFADGETYQARNIRGIAVTLRRSTGLSQPPYFAQCGNIKLSYRIAQKFLAVTKAIADRAVSEEKARLAAVERERLIKALKN